MITNLSVIGSWGESRGWMLSTLPSCNWSPNHLTRSLQSTRSDMAANRTGTPWLLCKEKVKNSRCRIFAFPSSGSNANSFYPWASDFAKQNIELISIQVRDWAIINSFPEIRRIYLPYHRYIINIYWSSIDSTSIGIVWGNPFNNIVCQQINQLTASFSYDNIVSRPRPSLSRRQFRYRATVCPRIIER